MKRIWLFLALLLLALLAIVAPSAPAPLPKIKPTPPFPVGVWQAEWGNSCGKMTLEANGNYIWGEEWKGSWGYNKESRILSVCERMESSTEWLIWHVQLDSENKGRTQPVEFAFSMRKVEK